MVKHDDILEQEVKHVRGIITLHRRVLNGNILKIAYGVGGRIAKDTIVLTAVSHNVESLHEVVESLGDSLLGPAAVFHGNSALLPRTIREEHGNAAMAHLDGCHGMDADETLSIVVSVVVGTLHEHRLRIEVTQPHIQCHGRDKVAKDTTTLGGIIKTCHILLPFPCF